MSSPDDTAALEKFDLPLVLVELGDFTVRAASPSALQRLRLSACDVVGHNALSLLVPGDDRERAATALAALRDGVVDFYRTSYTVRRGDGSGHRVWQWVRAVTLSGERLALAEGTPVGSPLPRPLSRHAGDAPETMAIGTVAP
ncbi:MAG TPA: hypothetical protein VMU14_04085, partial [Acidimicrobiales bacterium]|nr:hypothetical protein [Acidimicrobiales bacterium]